MPYKTLEDRRRHYHAVPEVRRKAILNAARWKRNNPEANAEISKRKRQRDPDYARRYRLAAIGWSIEAYDAAVIEQGNRCAICKKEFQDKPRPDADHDHSTNEPRGVLCHGCNCILGFASDDPNILEAAAEYLRHWSTLHSKEEAA